MAKIDETCSLRCPLHWVAVLWAIRARIETPTQPPALARLSGQKWLEMVVDAGVVRIDLVSGNFVINNKMHHE